MPLSKFQNFKILLASQSPRRKFLIGELGFPFETISNRDVEEVFPPNLKREEIALFLAELKANAYKDLLIDNNTIIITADTIVWLENEILHKPKDKADAVNILKKLSGKMHEVITGVSICSKQKNNTFCSITKVYFENLKDEEIEHYLENYKPYDKAGAYGVQEWIGYIGVKKIEGSFFNVMGLPIQKVYKVLEKMVNEIQNV
jgi:septum formation protein